MSRGRGYVIGERVHKAPECKPEGQGSLVSEWSREIEEKKKKSFKDRWVEEEEEEPQVATTLCFMIALFSSLALISFLFFLEGVFSCQPCP